MTEAPQTGPPTDPAPGTPAGDAERRDVNAEIQRVIVDLAENGKGRPIGELVPELERALAERGITGQPPGWLESIAREASRGHVYVADIQALEDVTGTEIPGNDPSTAAQVLHARGEGADGPQAEEER